MPKGTEAKENLLKKILESLSEDYIGCFDKKHYFWSKEEGQKVQVCITMTCPKTPVGVNDNTSNNNSLNFEEIKPERSEEEKKNIENLIERLGL